MMKCWCLLVIVVLFLVFGSALSDDEIVLVQEHAQTEILPEEAVIKLSQKHKQNKQCKIPKRTSRRMLFGADSRDTNSPLSLAISNAPRLSTSAEPSSASSAAPSPISEIAQIIVQQIIESHSLTERVEKESLIELSMSIGPVVIEAPISRKESKPTPTPTPIPTPISSPLPKLSETLPPINSVNTNDVIEIENQIEAPLMEVVTTELQNESGYTPYAPYTESDTSSSQTKDSEEQRVVIKHLQEFADTVFSKLNSDSDTTTEIPPEEPIQDDHGKERYNYASYECGAKVIEHNAEASGASAILLDSPDRYMINPCSARKWLTVELCEDITINEFSMGNLEFFSSSLKEFQLLGSPKFPTSTWLVLGNYSAENLREIMHFKVQRPEYVKYLKFRIKSHHGNAVYCPITQIKAFGSTSMEELKEELAKRTQKIQKLQTAIQDTDIGNLKPISSVPVEATEPQASVSSTVSAASIEENSTSTESASQPKPQASNTPHSENVLKTLANRINQLEDHQTLLKNYVENYLTHYVQILGNDTTNTRVEFLKIVLQAEQTKKDISSMQTSISAIKAELKSLSNLKQTIEEVDGNGWVRTFVAVLFCACFTAVLVYSKEGRTNPPLSSYSRHEQERTGGLKRSFSAGSSKRHASGDFATMNIKSEHDDRYVPTERYVSPLSPTNERKGSRISKKKKKKKPRDSDSL